MPKTLSQFIAEVEEKFDKAPILHFSVNDGTDADGILWVKKDEVLLFLSTSLTELAHSFAESVSIEKCQNLGDPHHPIVVLGISCFFAKITKNLNFMRLFWLPIIYFPRINKISNPIIENDALAPVYIQKWLPTEDDPLMCHCTSKAIDDLNAKITTFLSEEVKSTKQDS